MTGPSSLRIIIVRHGLTDHNKKKILQGHIDIELNGHGKHQATLAGNRLKDEGIVLDAVWSSDLSRCKQTTNNILEPINQLSLPVTYLSDLRERHMGELENMSVLDANAKCKREGKNFHDYGESHATAVKRLNTAFDSVLDTSIKQNFNTVMVVSHGGVISKFIRHLVIDKGFTFSPNVKDDDIKVPHNTSFTTVLVDKTTRMGIIDSFGDARHLGHELAAVDQSTL
jgi:probable phosphoglycerate mutase